jgi:hypothetical protein
MPPRITRLTWPRLFPPHEPLPFLYPRWYSVENAAVETTGSSAPKYSAASEGQDATTQNELEQGQTSVPNTKTHDGDIGMRRVPPGLKRKTQIRELQEMKRMELHKNSFYANDWRTPLALLRTNTPAGQDHHVKKLVRVEMPQGMRGFYPGNLSNLFLDIYLHTGCHVQIVRGDDHKDDKFSALELSGTLTSIGMAKNILNETVQVESHDNLNDKGNLGSYTITATPVVSGKVMPRSVWSMPSITATELYDVIEPTTWSFNAFSAYVEALGSSAAPPSRPKSATQSANIMSHVDLVIERLMALYKNPESVRWASMRATVLTLQYLTTKSKVPEVRLILELIEAQAKTHAYLRLILINPSVFNVLLASASQALDLHTYNFLLRMMTDRGVAPTVETWTSLLMLVRKVSPRNAKHIVNTMRQKDMLSSPPAKAATANVTLSASAAEWLARDESIFDFIAHYDKLWHGKEWLEPFGCNQLLTLLIERGNLQDTLPLIRELQNRNRKPNLVTAHILINGAASYRDLKFAIDAMEATMGTSKALQPDSDTFDKLFHLAFRVRAYNTLRVVWRYACLRGEVSREFIRKMQKTLLNPPREQGEGTQSLDVGVGVGMDDKPSRHQRFKALGPIVAVGIDEETKDAATLSAMTVKHIEDVTTTSPSDPAASSAAISPGSITASLDTTVSPHTTADVDTTGSLNATASPDNVASPDTTASFDLTASSDTTAQPDITVSTDTTASPDADSSLHVASPAPKRSSLHPILAVDILAYETLVPTIPFMSALRIAVDKDLLWKQQGYDKDASLQVLLANAIDVETKRRGILPGQDLVRKVTTAEPAVLFTEEKTRPVELPTLEFQDDMVRKIELVDDPSKDEPFVFQTAKLETEEEKQAYRDREAAAKKKLQKLRIIKNNKLKEERKRLEEKERLDSHNKLQKQKRLERQKRLAAKQTLSERNKVHGLQDLAFQLKMQEATPEEKTQQEFQQMLKRQEADALRKQEEELRKQEEAEAKEEAERRRVAKTKALEGWMEAVEERKQAEEKEEEAGREWMKLHEEMKEMMKRNKGEGDADEE